MPSEVGYLYLIILSLILSHSSLRRYCIADDRLVNAIEFLDLGNGAGWELLQAMLNADFRKRPTAEAVLSHRFMTGEVL
ncbi:unnamed protein product [Lathyrus sativus]|nr:unnamed protein product [Lathyrus sativus]